MEELVIGPRKAIKVTIEGTSYEVKKPSNGQLRALSEVDPKEGLQHTVELLDSLGLPSAVTWELEPESLQAITEALISKKKQ